MLAPSTLVELDRWWADELGCSPGELRPRSPLVFQRPRDDDFHGVYAMTFGAAAPVATVSSGLLPTSRARVERLLGRGSFDLAAWAGAFRDGVQAIVGPAVVRYADHGTFRPLPPSASVRLLSEDDEPAIARLRSACSATEWEHGGSEPGEHPVAGSFVDRELAAVAGFEPWGRAIAHISVVAHPALRGRGHAAAAVSRIVFEALARGLAAQYRTLEINAPSLSVAQRLGFCDYARSLAVRLASDGCFMLV